MYMDPVSPPPFSMLPIFLQNRRHLNWPIIPRIGTTYTAYIFEILYLILFLTIKSQFGWGRSISYKTSPNPGSKHYVICYQLYTHQNVFLLSRLLEDFFLRIKRKKKQDFVEHRPKKKVSLDFILLDVVCDIK